MKIPATLMKDYSLFFTGKENTLTQAERYCQYLATHHYENFTVVSWFLPKDKRQDFYNIYSYCRWADDLGDETGSVQQSIDLLSWWEDELISCYAGKPNHPVFQALYKTIEKYDIPILPFKNLIKAFLQDQTVNRYKTMDELKDYCCHSANPVGHLVLYLCGYRDEKRQLLSDKTCTALQLANFWQDITVDLMKGRIYLPLDDIKMFGYSEEMLKNKIFNNQFKNLMEYEVNLTRQMFYDGQELFELIEKPLRLDIELFNQGGLLILDAIEKNNYDVLCRRPSLTKVTKLRLMFQRIIGL